MDIFNLQRENNIPIKPYEVRAHKYKIWNNITQEYDDFTGGGGGDHTVLPEYLRSDHIHMKTLGSTEQLKVRNTGLTLIKDESEVDLNVDTILQDRNDIQNITDKVNGVNSDVYGVTDNNSILVYDSVNDKLRRTDHIKLNEGTNSLQIASQGFQFGDAVGTQTLTKDDVSFLNRIKTLDTEFLDNMVVGDFNIAWDSTNKKFRKTSNLILRSTPTASSYCTIGISGISFNKTSTGLQAITPDNILNIRTLLDTPVESTANTNMITYNPTTKIYNYTTIPSGSTPLPSWVETDRAYFTKGEGASMNGTIIDGDGILVRTTMINPVPPNGDLVRITNSGVTAGRWGASTQKTVLKRVGIEFWDSNPVPATLNYAKVLALSNTPKDLKWRAPIYSVMGGTAPSQINVGVISDYNLPINNIQAITNPGDVLWVDLSLWNAGVLNSDEGGRGFLLGLGVFQYTNTPVFKVSYSKSDVTYGFQSVTVRGPGGMLEQRCLFIWFKSLSGSSTSVNGWVRIEVDTTSFKQADYPRVQDGYATQSSLVL